jgi:hypothetical protein
MTNTNNPAFGVPDERLTATTARMDRSTPDPITVANERTVNLVTGICNETLLEIGRRRDELDNLAARITTSRNALTDYIQKFSALCVDVMKSAGEMKTTIEEVTLPFKADPPATLTVKPEHTQTESAHD